MNPQDFLENALFLNPFTLPIAIAQKVFEQGKKDKPEAQSTPKPPAPTAPPASPASTTPDLPAQQPVPPGGVGGGDLISLIREIEKIKQREADAARAFYPTKAQIDLDTYTKQLALAEQAGLEKMRQKTARDIELQTITAWQGITQAQINRDTQMGLGMMNLAYAGGLPNPNVLAGGASLAAQGRASYGTPSSVIS